jgi:hypothetical protein
MSNCGAFSKEFCHKTVRSMFLSNILVWTEGKEYGACGNLLLPARLVSQMTASRKGSQVQANPARPRIGFLARSWLDMGRAR